MCRRGMLPIWFAAALMFLPVQARAEALCVLLDDLAELEAQVLVYAYAPPEGAARVVAAERMLARIAVLEDRAASRQVAAHLSPAAARVLRDHLFSRHSMIWLVAQHSPLVTHEIIMRIRGLRPWHHIMALKLGAQCDPDLPPGMIANRPALPGGLTRGVLAAAGRAEADPASGARRPLVAEMAGERQGVGARRASLQQEMLHGALLLLAVALLVLALFAYRWSLRRHRRRAVRYSCHLQTHMELADAAHPAVILDISRLGCKLATSAAPCPGTRLSLGLGPQRVSGSVVWSNSHYAGVVFDKVLPRGQLTRLLSRT